MPQEEKSVPRLNKSMKELIPSISNHHAAQRPPQISSSLMDEAYKEFVATYGLDGLIDTLEQDEQYLKDHPDTKLADNIKERHKRYVFDLFRLHETEILDEVRMFENDQETLEDYTKQLLIRVLSIEKDKRAPHLPVHLYGSRAENVAREIAKAYDISIDTIVGAMMIATATAAGNKFAYTYGPYKSTTLTTWLCVIARSGYGKTRPMAEVLKPLIDVNEKLIDARNQRVIEWEMSRTGEPPKQKQLLIDDTTPEARAALLAQNPHGVLLYRDELEGMFNDIGRYNNSGEVQKYLEIWSGQAQNTNRKSSNESTFVKRPILHICGGIQEAQVPKVFSRHSMMENGFFARWLFVRVTDIFRVERDENRGVPDDVRKEWRDFLLSLYDEGTQPRNFTLSLEGQRLFKQHVTRLRIESYKQNTKTSRGAQKQQMLSKLEIHTLKLASIIHLLKEGHSASDVIPVETIQAAIETADTFKAWNYATLDLIEPPMEKGNENLRFIEASKADALKLLMAMYPEAKGNISKLASALHVSRQSLYNNLAKAGVNFSSNNLEDEAND